jgi:hypothetical protein
VTLRTVLIVAVIAGTLALLFVRTGPRLTGPPVIDCGGGEPAVCDAKLRETALFVEQAYGWTGPVAYCKFEPSSPGAGCGATIIEVFVFTFGPLGWTEGVGGNPLC